MYTTFMAGLSAYQKSFDGVTGELNKEELVRLFGSLSILIYKCTNESKDSDLLYKTQDLQSKVMEKIMKGGK